MQFNQELLYASQVNNQPVNTIKGDYQAKYVKSIDTIMSGKNGQIIRETFNDINQCSVIEILPLAKPINQRYNDYFQKSYSKGIYSSRNIITQFNILYNVNIKDKPIVIENSLILQVGDYNILYSEKSNNKLNNSVLGNELVLILNSMLDLLGNMNTDISLHGHENVAQPLGWRLSEIQQQIDKLKNNLPNILSTQNFIN